ncbi:ABC transporter ATP-binding protein [Streptomyces fradiae]|uniref:ABC transporter ATP-binding protein n=1 Tax=Streptomyces fradiae TaxID=1906 RepID=UPI00294370B4|nr:ABC transporter ATP-binding protein [Streptomyces fradiae]WOI59724.1 ABC transporter ATP-binding protein [Streptomyces fradiae]
MDKGAATPRLPARETWRALYRHFRPHRAVVALGTLLALVGTVAGLAQPLAAKALVERLGRDESIAGVLLALTALVVAGTAVQAVGSYVLERTAESVVLAARRSLVGRLLRLRLAEVERTQPGDLMSRITSDTTLLRAVTTQSVVSAVTGGVGFVATLVMMLLMDAVLLGVTLGVIVLVGGAFALAMPRIAEATRRSQEAVGEISSRLERVFGAFRTVKASGAEERETAAVEAAAREAWRHGVKAAKWQALAGSSVGLAIQVSFLAVLGIGGARVASGAITVAELIAFLLYLFYLMEPVSQLVEAATQYQKGSAAIARVEEAERLAVEDPAGAAGGPGAAAAGSPAGGAGSAVGGAGSPVGAVGSPVGGAGSAVGAAGSPSVGAGPAVGGGASVVFEDVAFRYRDDLPYVHHGVSFEVPGPGMTAFVGPSGAGKTTVFGLVERFYEATGGRVLVDGRDVRDWPVAELRASIGYVEQDAPVLAGTLRDNLLFAAPDATEEDIRGVLVRARLDALVERLPEGLDTLVGHRGSKLSGGERQRVAVARALLRKPRLLLLDEATSQLDAVNEMALRDVVAEAARDVTVLVVAHRLSTVTLADRIVVMDAGRVRAVGTHEELVAGDPLYGELAATQFLAARA